MQSSDFPPEGYKKWFRRPTIFAAVTWLLSCAAGQIILARLAGPLSNAFSAIGIRSSGRALALALGAVYRLGLMLLPVYFYAKSHEGVTASMRLKKPKLITLLYAPVIGAALVPLTRVITILWSLMLQAAGGTPTYSVRGPNGGLSLIVCLLLDALIAGVCEELMLRGAVLGAWERRGTERGLVVVTLFSALLCGSVIELPANALLYAMFGLITVMSGSLYVGMLAHVSYSALMILLDTRIGSYEIHDFLRVIIGEGRLGVYLATLVWSLGLYAALIYLFRSVCVHGGSWSGFHKEKTPEEMDPAEVLILGVALITVFLLCGENFLSIIKLK